MPTTSQKPRRERGEPTRVLGLNGAPRTVPPALRHYDGIPTSIMRLDAIRRGQRMRFYRGDPEEFNNVKTPTHTALLMRVFAHARLLEAQGKLRIREETVDIANLKMIDFIAIGL